MQCQPLDQRFMGLNLANLISPLGPTKRVNEQNIEEDLNNATSRTPSLPELIRENS